jgi:hypothetical protein
MVVGALGTLWVVFWLAAIRTDDLKSTPAATGPALLVVLAWLIVLQVVDAVVHVAAAAPAYLPDAARAPAARLFAAAPWLPLVSKAVVTALGILGVFAWLWRVTRDDDDMPRGVFFIRFWVLATTVVMINATWHFFRAWMPLFLQKQHGYSLEAFNLFSVFYYIATDAGTLTAGFAALFLARRGLSVHRSRLTVFTLCALLTTLSLVAATLPPGPILLGVLLVIGFGALGLFPAYYSFSQDLTVRHQGKLTGALGCTCWLAMALLQEAAGDLATRTGSYTQGVALSGLAPWIALAALILLWGRSSVARNPETVPSKAEKVAECDERIHAAQPGIQQV